MHYYHYAAEIWVLGIGAHYIVVVVTAASFRLDFFGEFWVLFIVLDSFPDDGVAALFIFESALNEYEIPVKCVRQNDEIVSDI